jgi:hypothetical protein
VTRRGGGANLPSPPPPLLLSPPVVPSFEANGLHCTAPPSQRIASQSGRLVSICPDTHAARLLLAVAPPCACGAANFTTRQPPVRPLKKHGVPGTLHHRPDAAQQRLHRRLEVSTADGDLRGNSLAALRLH